MVKKILSYFWPQNLKNIKPQVLPSLEINMHQGQIYIDGADVNYSFGSLHQVFRKAIKQEIDHFKQSKSVLILGFGAGSIAKIINNEWALNHLEITGVEIEPAMIELAREIGEIDNFEKINLQLMDAQKFMAANTQKYDVILIDIFIENIIPPFCFEEAFLGQLKEALAKNGLIIWNSLKTNTLEQHLQNSDLKTIRKKSMQDQNVVFFLKS